MCGRKMALVHGHAFAGLGLSVNAARSVKAGPVVTVIAYHRTVYISIMYHRAVYIKYSRIVPEMVACPSAANKPYAGVAETIINTAIKAYVRPPVSCVKQVNAIVKSPVAGRP